MRGCHTLAVGRQVGFYKALVGVAGSRPSEERKVQEEEAGVVVVVMDGRALERLPSDDVHIVAASKRDDVQSRFWCCCYLVMINPLCWWTTQDVSSLSQAHARAKLGGGSHFP